MGDPSEICLPNPQDGVLVEKWLPQSRDYIFQLHFVFRWGGHMTVLAMECGQKRGGTLPTKPSHMVLCSLHCLLIGYQCLVVLKARWAGGQYALPFPAPAPSGTLCE